MHSLSTPPAVGLGLWKIPNAQTAGLVREAIGAGYRHLDSACDYGNERETGEGIRRALNDGLCRRDDLWVTSKLWNTYHKAEHVRPALERTLSDMGLKHLDLFLIHFPIPLAFVPFETRYPPGWTFDPQAAKPAMKPASVPIIETWQAMADDLPPNPTLVQCAGIDRDRHIEREKREGRLRLGLKALEQKTALLHGHCHQKAFGAMSAVQEVLCLVPELKVTPIESSCCGMAGSFGYEAEHYEASMAMGELSLLPAVRKADPDTLIIADGTSCRHQITDGADRQAIHVAQVLERALA